MFLKVVCNVITDFYVFFRADFKNAIRFFSITSGFLTKKGVSLAMITKFKHFFTFFQSYKILFY